MQQIIRRATVVYFLFLSYHIIAQSKQVGAWRYYFNNTEYYNLENIDGNIYINAHRIIIDLNDKTFQKNILDKTNSLSDYSISNFAYSPEDKRLVIAYENTMLDIIDFTNGKKKLTSNYDVFNKLLVADKSILQIKFSNSKAYLCSKIGIVVLDYNLNEIRETYIIGDNGKYTPVMTMEKLGDEFFAATPQGIKRAKDLPAINLQNYINWTLDISNFPLDSFTSSTTLNNEIYLMSPTQVISSDGAGNINTILIADTLQRFQKIRKFGTEIYLIYDSLDTGARNKFYSSRVLRIAPSIQNVLEAKSRRLYDMVQNNSKEFLYAGEGGIMRWEDNVLKGLDLGTNVYDYPFRLQLHQDRTIVNMGVMARNLDANLNPTGHFELNEGWITLKGLWNDSFYGCTNQLSAIERDGGLYRAFVRGGVSFEKQGQPIKRFHTYNSKLDTLGGDGYRISDMVLNPIDNSIWISNISSTEPLKCLTADGKWYSFDISSVTTSREIYKIVIDQAGNKWLLMRGDGLILFNEKNITNTQDDIIRRYTEIPKTKYNSCQVSLLGVSDAVVDREGILWIATSKGVGYVLGCTYDPDEPCEFDVPIQRIINPNDTAIYDECAFLNTAVSALAVDAGNHLWVGTSDGVFYNREAMDLEFLRLNKLNSPFSPKSVYDILVHPKSGEVFFSTEIGLLSYIGQSTSGEFHENRSPYLVIPNPIPKDYEGLISIDGIPENAYYKITDVVGNLVYQGQANGSRVTWDGRTLMGNKVPIGVYYIFSGYRELKGNTGIGKFTVIR